MSNNIRAKVLDIETIAQVVEYIKAGGSYNRAADALGVAHTTLIYHCKRAGIGSIHGPGKIKKTDKLPELPVFVTIEERKEHIKILKTAPPPLPSRFDRANSWYLSCVAKSKMSRKQKKEIEIYYNEHKDDSQQVIYNVNISDFSNLELC